MLALFVTLGVLVAIVGLSAIVSYNRFVSQNRAVQSRWSSVDIELKRRCELVPNLIAPLQGCAAHERNVFEDVARTRAAAHAARGPAAAGAAEGPFAAALERLIALAESYPELIADESFQQLQVTLADAEDRIQQSRSLYNSVVWQFNRRVQSFPSHLIAAACHFRSAGFFHIDASPRSAVGQARRDEVNRAAASTAAPAASSCRTSRSG